MNAERRTTSPASKTATSPVQRDSEKWVEVPIKADRSNFKQCGGGPICHETR